ncbi:ABC transporter substrate-binding protein [Planococcus sp. YIM B11945]|uniref:ABC transporter substrate-binding protein n=1 Tax=Planococcus sp. YIM B11945 TaxID=3435410 RepID=UPI003D7DAA78
MKSRFFKLLVLMMIAMLFAAACSQDSGGTSETGEGEAGGGTLIVGLEAEPTSFDAHQLSDYNSSRAAMELYDQLVQFKDGSTELEPGLAEKWEISEDGMEYTFFLREGVKFHDGTDFNAEAVKFSIERQIDPEHPFHDTGQFAYADFTFGMVDSVEVLEDYQVKIKLKEPFAPFLSNMAMHAASIVSPAAVEKYGKDFTKNPVGTGPFKFVSWSPGVEAVLERNDDYFGEVPKLEKVIMKPIAEAQTRLAELEAGNIHLIVNVPPDDLVRLEGDPNVQKIEQAGMHVWWTAFNTQKEPFNDVKVRQAVNYAVNKEEIIDGLLQGTGELANSPIPPSVWGHNANVKNYPHDPEKAKQLLAEAGYPDGFEVDYWVPESGSGMQQPQVMAAAIQADLEKVGIKLNIQTFEWGTYLDKVFVPFEESDMDMHQMSWVGDNGDPDNFLYILLSGQQVPPNGFNDSYYNNEEVNQLLAEARVTSDKAERTEMYERVQEIFMEEAPWLVLDYEKQIVLAAPNVKNFELHPTGVFRFSKVVLE